MRVVVVMTLALVTAVCGGCSTRHPSAAGAGLDVGTQIFPVAERAPAPDLHGTTITGDPFDLADVLGHGPVAVNVWASWCGPCRHEMPLLAHVPDVSLRVVGIDERDNSASARSFAGSRDVHYPNLADPDGQLLARLRMLPQSGVPSTIFLDRHGRVAARVIGPMDRHVLSQILRHLGAPS